MQHDAFDEPVTIFVGLGYPREIHTATEAYAFMNEWPLAHRRPGHTAAMTTCRIAMNGGALPTEARAAFAAFARRAGILAPEIDEIAGTVQPSLGRRTAA